MVGTRSQRRSSSGDWPPDVPLYAPILRPPRNMFCVGLNYVTHYEEGDRQGAKMPEHPVFFTKPWTTLIGPNDDLVIDRSATEKADWEAELAVVIGVGGANINEDDALEHVFGYCLANDVSARDLQLANGPFSQWDKGKGLDGFCPLGPYLVRARVYRRLCHPAREAEGKWFAEAGLLPQGHVPPDPQAHLLSFEGHDASTRRRDSYWHVGGGRTLAQSAGVPSGG